MLPPKLNDVDDESVVNRSKPALTGTESARLSRGWAQRAIPTASPQINGEKNNRWVIAILLVAKREFVSVHGLIGENWCTEEIRGETGSTRFALRSDSFSRMPRADLDS